MIPAEHRLPPLKSPPPAPRRQWPLYALCLALLVALVVVALVSKCPPVPAPAGQPVQVEAPAGAHVVVDGAPVPAAPQKGGAK